MQLTSVVVAMIMVLCPDAIPGVSSPDFGDDERPPSALSYGDYGMWTGSLNDRLRELGFNANDGNEFGRRTRHAVYAFEKYHGLEADGIVEAREWELLETRPWVVPASPRDRIEIDLARQLLFVVRSNHVEHVLPISSGNGASYVNGAGNTVQARTPEGRFLFRSRIAAMHYSYLGAMYYPYYFYGGYAVHGSPSVPNYPASHGCVRVTYRDMDLLWDHLDIGQRVLVYGRGVARPSPHPVGLPAPEHL